MRQEMKNLNANKCKGFRHMSRKEKPHCYKCKGFRHIRNEHPNLIKEEEKDKKKENEKKEKRQKDIKGHNREWWWVDIEEILEEFCFITNDEEEEIDEEHQSKIEDIYQNLINVDKINKDLKMMVQSLISENEGLKAKVASLKQINKVLISTNKVLRLHLEGRMMNFTRCLMDLKSCTTRF